MIQRKANPNIKDESSRTAMHLVNINDKNVYLNIVKYLISNGADFYSEDNNNRPVIYYFFAYH